MATPQTSVSHRVWLIKQSLDRARAAGPLLSGMHFFAFRGEGAWEGGQREGNKDDAQS